MSFPSPSPQQARILWMSVTALAVGVLLSLIALFLVGSFWLLKILSPVVLPIAIAGIIAYLLDPLVDLLERKGVPRGRAIILVFFITIALIVGLVASVVPRMVVEAQALQKRYNQENIEEKIRDLLDNPPFGIKLPDFLQSFQRTGTNAVPAATNQTVTTDSAEEEAMTSEPPTGQPREGEVEGALLSTDEPAVTTTDGAPREVQSALLSTVARFLPTIWNWIEAQISKVASWVGLLIGLALVPVYVFYFLWEKSGISEKWTNYLPVYESKIKDEVVFILRSINYYLILFFRGQVLVAMCDGVLLTIGFLIIGLDFAILLGIIAGALSIVPFLGVVLSLLPALILAAVQFGDWLHPLLVLIIFGLVQLAEGLVISPKIMGDRVGLHPLTIIIAVMVGTTLMGGILGGILAIPLTAALRVLMFRYVWRTRAGPAISE